MKYDVGREVDQNVNDSEKREYLKKVLKTMIKFPGQLKFSENQETVIVQIDGMNYKGTISYNKEGKEPLNINITGPGFSLKNKGDGYMLGTISQGNQEFADGYYEMIVFGGLKSLTLNYYMTDSIEYLTNLKNSQNVSEVEVNSNEFEKIGIIPDEYERIDYTNSNLYDRLCDAINRWNIELEKIQKRINNKDKLKK